MAARQIVYTLESPRGLTQLERSKIIHRTDKHELQVRPSHRQEVLHHCINDTQLECMACSCGELNEANATIRDYVNGAMTSCNNYTCVRKLVDLKQFHNFFLRGTCFECGSASTVTPSLVWVVAFCELLLELLLQSIPFKYAVCPE
jgi:hypothetical protein